MKVSYFPGCTLRTKAKQLDVYARECAKKLGVEMYEVPDWQCCGGAFVSARDEIATKLASVRALRSAKKAGMPLVTVCSACHNVIKQTNHAIRTDEEFAKKVNLYLAQDRDGEEPYNGETEVIHYLELLRNKIGMDKVAEVVTNPLSGKRIAAYYGCMILRPGKVLAFDDPENPSTLETLISALGAEPVVYPMRNECCGGYVVLEDADLAKKRSLSVAESAKNCGADMIVTACPLCKYNLERSGCALPVVYFTELMAEAFSIKEEGNAE